MIPTIILADDHPVTLNGISHYVASLGYNVVNMYTNGITACNNLLALKPDFAILDISMPGMTGLEILEKVKKENKTIKIILYTMYHDTSLFEKAKKLNVNGYILKDFALEEIAACLDYLKYKKQWFSSRLNDALVVKETGTAAEKLESLSPAERKIISLIAKRKTSKQIAEQLFITEKTIENHRSNIIRKLGLQPGNNALAVWAVQHIRE